MRSAFFSPFYSKAPAYWAIMDKRSDKTHQHDFVSVHKLSLRVGYGLFAPLCLVSRNGERPKFENLLFPRKCDAVVYAKMVARSIPGGHVVDCS